jgi:hypothetical protein
MATNILLNEVCNCKNYSGPNGPTNNKLILNYFDVKETDIQTEIEIYETDIQTEKETFETNIQTEKEIYMYKRMKYGILKQIIF